MQTLFTSTVLLAMYIAMFLTVVITGIAAIRAVVNLRKQTDRLRRAQEATEKQRLTLMRMVEEAKKKAPDFDLSYYDHMPKEKVASDVLMRLGFLGGTHEDKINLLITSSDVDTNKLSDGYHTFGELYEHRILLFILVCKLLYGHPFYTVWRSRKHHDGGTWPGWFIMGIIPANGEQMSYHLSEDFWGATDFVPEWECAPEWDGHTSEDVAVRLRNMLQRKAIARLSAGEA